MKRFDTYKVLAKEIGGVKKPIRALTFFKIWSFILGLAPLFLYSFLIKVVLIDSNLNALWYIITGYLGVYFLETIGIISCKKYSNRLIVKFDLKLKNKLIRKYSLIDNNLYSVGDVRKRIENDATVAGKFFITHILDFTYSCFYAIVLSIILISYDWKIAIISFICIPFAFSTVDFLGKRIKTTGDELRNLQAKYESFLHSTFQNWKDIKINNLEDQRYNELNCHLKKIRKLWFVNRFYLHVGITFSFFTKNFITQLFIYIIGGYFVIKGYSTIATLLIFTKFYGKFFGCIQEINNSIINFRNDSVNIEKVIEILNEKIVKKPYKKIEGVDITVNELAFSYDSNSNFKLDDVSFSVQKGEHLAIVGESGSGKSTIVKLLTRQIVPQRGNVIIGGTDISTVNNRSIYDKVSVVVQEPILFNMTIRENLLLGNAFATKEQIDDSCIQASIYGYIMSLPEGMNTIVGEKGVKLSGGQRQRLALARAFLQNRDIIIFDESTNALDSEKENNVISELRNFSSGKTMISIAHRLSTILDCDRVMIIKNGSIVDIDTHEKLRNRSNDYNLLFKNQYIV